MAFDEHLAERIRGQIGRRKAVTEKKLFGGIAFLINGNMAVGIHSKEMIVRLAPEKTDAALAKPQTRRFDLTGRPMKGWILVKPAGLKTDAALGKWIRVGLDFASSLSRK